MVLMALIFIGVPILEFFRTSNPSPQITVEAVETLISLGLEAYQQGDLAAAVGYFFQAVEVDPEDADSYFYLGRAYYDNGDLKEMKTYYE